MPDSGADFGSGLYQRLKSLVVCQPDWEELVQLEDDCPLCGSERYYKDQGRLTSVYRCRDCPSEGIGPK